MATKNKLIKCPNCGKTFERYKLPKCPHCGAVIRIKDEYENQYEPCPIMNVRTTIASDPDDYLKQVNSLVVAGYTRATITKEGKKYYYYTKNHHVNVGIAILLFILAIIPFIIYVVYEHKAKPFDRVYIQIKEPESK